MGTRAAVVVWGAVVAWSAGAVQRAQVPRARWTCGTSGRKNVAGRNVAARLVCTRQYADFNIAFISSWRPRRRRQPPCRRHRRHFPAARVSVAGG